MDNFVFPVPVDPKITIKGSLLIIFIGIGTLSNHHKTNMKPSQLMVIECVSWYQTARKNTPHNTRPLLHSRTNQHWPRLCCSEFPTLQNSPQCDEMREVHEIENSPHHSAFTYCPWYYAFPFYLLFLYAHVVAYISIKDLCTVFQFYSLQELWVLCKYVFITLSLSITVDYLQRSW